jgi:hypothetical protein
MAVWHENQHIIRLIVDQYFILILIQYCKQYINDIFILQTVMPDVQHEVISKLLNALIIYRQSVDSNDMYF